MNINYQWKEKVLNVLYLMKFLIVIMYCKCLDAIKRQKPVRYIWPFYMFYIDD